MKCLPLEEDLIGAIAELFNDGGKRKPSHYDIENVIRFSGFTYPESAEGKAKKIRSVLWKALSNGLNKSGGELCFKLYKLLFSMGAFRADSQNYAGEESIGNFRIVLKKYSYSLSSDGYLAPASLENLSGIELTKALLQYARRAQNGIEDAALVVGTGKDLLEATAKHVLIELENPYSENINFPFLLGQCFMALGLKTSAEKHQQNERKTCEIERKLYDLAILINQLRNKEGSGHGRPFPHSINDRESKTVIELTGVIAERLLTELAEKKEATALAMTSH